MHRYSLTFRGKRRPQKTRRILMSTLINYCVHRISLWTALTLSLLSLSIKRLLNTVIGNVSPIYVDIVKQAEVMS